MMYAYRYLLQEWRHGLRVRMPSLGTYIMNLSLLRKRIPIIMESKVIPILDLEGKRKKRPELLLLL